MKSHRRRLLTVSFEPAALELIKCKVLEWLVRSGTFIYLDSHSYADPYGRYEMLAACSPLAWYRSLQELKQQSSCDWAFGHLAFTYKDQLFADLPDRHGPASDGFGAMSFFQPETVCYIRRSVRELVIETVADPRSVAAQINRMHVGPLAPLPALQFQRRQDQAAYKAALAQVLEHIAAGDCYELNYCCEAVAKVSGLDPLQVYRHLKQTSPAPFSVFYRSGDAWMMGASPERFVCKREGRLLAQPIKGTAPRGRDEEEDEALKRQLRQSGKEQAEHVMIVDLMRNDLARCCEQGSITVAELMGIYSFPTVHQMISTVSGVLRPEQTIPDVLAHLFPAGSMTGAPKKRVLALTDALEERSRGIYAGTVGYLAPDGDADFNVVIRSLLYHAGSGRLAYHTGGAITRQSIPALEWEELLLKGRALERLFLPEGSGA